MISRAAIIEEARTWIGTPFHHQARVKQVGADCGMVPVCLGRAMGLEVHDLKGYSRQPDGESLMRAMRAQPNLIEIDPEEAWPGSVLVFYINARTRYPQHFGLLTDHGLLHCWADVGKVVEHHYTEKWRKRVVAAFDFAGVDEWPL